MDNLGNGNLGNQNLNRPIPLDNDSEKPIPLDDIEAASPSVSHSALDLGGSRPVGINKAAKPQPPQPPAAVQAAAMPAPGISMGRITNIKTFFTKLHIGALTFLDEQIGEWLKKNPDIIIKQTNVCVGELQGKKTEPNIVITVWY